MIQLSLGISLNDEATFENYYVAGESSGEIVTTLKSFASSGSENNLLIWGARGAGLTHLLQATCRLAYQQKRSIQYLPLREMVGFAPEDICEGLEALDLVCIDGLDEICGNRGWEQALFHLYNRLRDSGRQLLVSSHTSPASMPLLLHDLKSRLYWGPVLRVASLNDGAKQHAIQNRARARGFELSDDVARYILTHASRDINELFFLLNRLDDASLQEQRKLTIPFVKEVMMSEVD